MKLPSLRLLKLASWTTGAYAIVQGLRLVTNVVLARLLSPELFGIMLIVNTLRTGVDLLSDVGIGQNVVSNKNGEDPDFYNTAWTLQVIRGAILCLLCSALAVPLARLYDMPILASALPIASLYFLALGLMSISPFLLHKRLALGRLSVFEIAAAAASAVVHICFALISPTIWALIYGGVFAGAASMVGSYLIIPGLRHRFRIAKEYAFQIIHFGKWILLSSLVYFLAMNFDRLYLGKTIPLALLGIYGVARSLSDMLSLLVGKLGISIVFPVVAASRLSRGPLRQQLAGTRLQFLLAAAAGVSLFAVVSEIFVELLYDNRYHAAALMLPYLSLGVWLSILCTMGEPVLLGLGRPAYGAFANMAKLGTLLVALPLGIAWYGMAGAIGAVVLAEGVRYFPLLFGQFRERIQFAGQDFLATLVMFAMIGVWQALLGAFGWNSQFTFDLTPLTGL